MEVELRQLRGLLREGVAGGEEALRDESVTTCIFVGALVARAGDGDPREGAQGVISLLASTAACRALAFLLASLVSGIQELHSSPSSHLLCKIF